MKTGTWFNTWGKTNYSGGGIPDQDSSAASTFPTPDTVLVQELSGMAAASKDSFRSIYLVIKLFLYNPHQDGSYSCSPTMDLLKDLLRKKNQDRGIIKFHHIDSKLMECVTFITQLCLVKYFDQTQLYRRH